MKMQYINTHPPSAYLYEILLCSSNKEQILVWQVGSTPWGGGGVTAREKMHYDCTEAEFMNTTQYVHEFGFCA